MTYEARPWLSFAGDTSRCLSLPRLLLKDLREALREGYEIEFVEQATEGKYPITPEEKAFFKDRLNLKQPTRKKLNRP